MALEPLTFAELATVNAKRCKRWHDADTEQWSGADWSNAMCGEAGEAANVVKKLRRHETGTASAIDPPEATLRTALGHEIADVILYAFLLADHYGIDVEQAVIEKFNAVSDRQAFPEMLGGVESRAVRIRARYGCDAPWECVAKGQHGDVP